MRETTAQTAAFRKGQGRGAIGGGGGGRVALQSAHFPPWLLDSPPTLCCGVVGLLAVFAIVGSLSSLPVVWGGSGFGCCKWVY